MIRFVPWSEVGTISVSPGDDVVEVGSFELAEGADTLWVRMTNTGTPGPWPWSYGILSFKTEEGQPLGSIKAYNSYEGEVFRLGVGLPPSVRSGVLTFEPRGFNMAWIKQGNDWSLKFEAQSGSSSAVSSSYWNRDSGTGKLFPANSTDDVEIGIGNIELNADGSSKFAGTVKVNRPQVSGGGSLSAFNVAYGGVERANLTNGAELRLSDSTATRKITLTGSDGSATFAGIVTAPNITFRSSDPSYYKTEKGSTGESTYTGPQLDLLQEIHRLEVLVGHLYETLRLNPPAGWEVWDGEALVKAHKSAHP